MGGDVEVDLRGGRWEDEDEDGREDGKWGGSDVVLGRKNSALLFSSLGHRYGRC